MLSIQTLTSLLPLLAASALALPATIENKIPQYYGIQAIHSTAPIHLQFLSASRNRFFIGNDTASYCPDTVTAQGGVCPPGKSTVFGGECSLYVSVPGGQQLYVTPEGELGFTIAHSGALPTDSITCPLTLTPAKSNGDNDSVQPGAEVGSKAFGATGLMACPTPEGPYQVFAAIQNATVPMGNVKACIGFLGLAYDAGDDFGAWQYS